MHRMRTLTLTALIAGGCTLACAQAVTQRPEVKPDTKIVQVPGQAAVQNPAAPPAPANPDQSEITALKTKATAGDGVAANRLGEIYGIGQGVPRDLKEAAKWFKKGAESGNAASQVRFGLMCEAGFGVQSDIKQALFWYEKAADQGNQDALMRLGMAHEVGRDIPKNGKEAVKWYEKAANLGNTKAQVRLGSIYRDGLDNVQHDYVLAMKWYRKAADTGDADGQYNVGYMYEQGLGVNASPEQAIAWYEKAGKQGHVIANAALRNLRR